MEQIKIIVRTADRTRKAEVTVSPEQRVGEILDSAQSNWALPRDVDYNLINTSNGRTLNLGETLREAGVSDGDTIEVQPVLVAGKTIDECP